VNGIEFEFNVNSESTFGKSTYDLNQVKAKQILKDKPTCIREIDET
jgi:hypothetical protein